MKVFLVSPYHSGSHAAWAEGYRRSSSHEVELITMDGRFWKWRMHGAPVTLAESAGARAAELGAPDVVLTTDMLDLPSFRGLATGPVGKAPAVAYFHENQLTYPIGPRGQEDLTFAAMNWKTSLAADAVLFNSEFHRRAFLEALPPFLKNFPDHRHLHRIDEVVAKSSVLPVGVDLRRFPEGHRADPPLVLWAQRWEHDKNPEMMIAAIDDLLNSGREVRIALAGENFRNVPDEFLAARERWGGRLEHFGWADEDRYARLVADADIVISTAEHEFFGIAVVEALSAGAWALLPNRLSYPEILDPANADHHLYADFADLTERLRSAVDEIDARRTRAAAERGYYRCYDWSQVAPAYDRFLESVVGGA